MEKPVEPGSLRDHVLIVGPPGTGKILWARMQRDRMPYADWGLREGDSEYLWRVAGLGEQWNRDLPKTCAEGTWRACPFRAPHHTVSETGLTGSIAKGWRLRPGELSLAHGGILLLDEATEFRSSVMAKVAEVVRAGVVRLSSGSLVLSVPAEFRLVLAATPCPCGYRGHERQPCRCSDAQVDRYRARLEPLSRLCRLVPAAEWQAEVKAAVGALQVVGGGA